jgi:CBS domain-containing protein
MGIDKIMQKRLVVTGLDETVAAAARRMSDHNLGALLVVEGGKLAGIFTERDLLTRVVAVGRDPATTKVGEVATRDPVTVRAAAPIDDCYRILQERGFRHLPVVEAEGAPVGMISARDFLQRMVVELSREVDMELFFTNVGVMDLPVFGA